MSLLAFGVDSVIEALSACVLLWRLNVELRDGQAFSEEAEHKASKLGGMLLFALAPYVVVSAAWGLWAHNGQEFSPLGLAITAATIPVMYVLAKRKIAVAEKIGSRALRADAIESITCGWLSFVVVAGLLAQLALGTWWIDLHHLACHRLFPREGRPGSLGGRGMRLLARPLRRKITAINSGRTSAVGRISINRPILPTG